MILITEAMHPAGLSRLSERNVRYEPALYQKTRQLQSLLPSTEALIVRNQTRVDRALLAHAPHLKVVGRLGVGLDNIDVAALDERGIALVVPRGANSAAVAEYVMGALLAYVRRFESLVQAVRTGYWERSMTTPGLWGRHLRIVGFGATGRAVAERAQAFGLVLSVYDPFIPEQEIPRDWRVTSLLDDLKTVDYISLHVPETPQTRSLINQPLLSCLKPSAVLINTARGGLVDEEALQKWLEDNPSSGAILDVRGAEPPGVGDALLGCDRVWTTPHVAGLTDESQQAIAIRVADQVNTFLYERQEA